jgi:hypothetical protein
MSRSRLSIEAAPAIAEEAYVFGYPLVLMDVMRGVMTATPEPIDHKAPINQFLHTAEYPDPADQDIVSPCVDSLYSIAWLDLTEEPIILTTPATRKRYYSLQLLDAWTNVVASVSSQRTGTEKASVVIVGPGWTGRLPARLPRLHSRTSMACLIGRTQTNGKDDYIAVHAFQKQYLLTPLSSWGMPYKAPSDVAAEPNVDAVTPPVDQVSAMNGVTFFSRLNALMKTQTPSPFDGPATRRFAAVGIASGKEFDPHLFDSDQTVANGKARILAAARKYHGKRLNGWDVNVNHNGQYGTQYLFRAVAARTGFETSRPDDLLHARATVDSDGQPLTGISRYTIRLDRNQLPPVDAFWSLTVYNSRQFLAPNPIDRYAIGDRNRLRFDVDGMATLYVQHESPGPDTQLNWLPAPSDDFSLSLRLYWPGKQVLDGSWKMPAIRREKAPPRLHAA